MKKILCIMLSVATVFLFSCCNSQKAQLKSELEENWVQYLLVKEKMNSAIEWGSEYIISFCENPNIESYKRAVSAGETVAATVKVLEVPDFTVTQQTVDSALSFGADVSFMTIEFSQLEKNLEQTASVWESITRDVVDEGFWSYGTEYLEKKAELQLEHVKLDNEYLRYTTNYLQLLLERKNYPEGIEDTCPAIFNQDEGFINSIAQVEQQATGCLDEIEALGSLSAEISAIQKANSTLRKKAVSSGDYSDLYSKVLPWAENIFVVPMPLFDCLPVLYSYSYDESSGEVAWTNAGADLTDVPSGLMISYHSVTKQELKQYIYSLYTLGFGKGQLTGNFDDTEPVEFLYADGENEFAVKWENGGASVYITQPYSCVCPYWYINCRMS